MYGFKRVKVRENRECSWCRGMIMAGCYSYTFSRKYKGRKWVCCNCYRLSRNVSKVRGERCLVPFDDEVGVLALEDYISEVESDFVEREGSYKGRVVE